MDEESGGGFSFLFSKLCELSFNNEANKGWDVYRRPRYTDRRREALKLCLYETLFEELRAPWVGELRRTQNKLNQDENCPFGVFDKLSITAFKLRLARRFDDADQLEHLVCKWRNLDEPCSSSLDFNDTNKSAVMEKEAILRFLVALSGSGTSESPGVLGHHNDLWVKKSMQIHKTSLPEGPLLITDSHLLRQGALEFDHYVHYSRELFECPPVLSVPGNDPSKRLCQTQQIFEELPGSFRGKARFFTRQDFSEDVHGKDGRSALFSALVHSRTDNIQVTLELPQLPSASNTLHFLATEQRETTEDEGFESLETSSNSSTSSEQAMALQEKTDIWTAALNLPTHRYFTWEMEGRRELLDEKPFLTEAGPAVFDALYDTVICQVSYIVKPPISSHNVVSINFLIKDSVNVLIGVPSRTFHLDKAAQCFNVNEQVRLSGTSPEMIRSILTRLAVMGTDYIQLNKFATHQRGQTAGLVLQAFLGALQNYLQCYRATVLSVNVSSVQSPLLLTFAFDNLAKQLRFLANVCMCSQAFKKAPDDPKLRFPTGVELLTYLYQLCLEHSSSNFYPILLSLLKHSLMPYIMFVQTWVFKGICNDMFGEFMIEMDEQYLAYRDKHFWTHGYVMVGRDKLDCVPLFLGELAEDIFVCGKTINLLKLCCPEHFLCDPGIPLPRMEVTFSMARLNKLEGECKQYMEAVQTMYNQLQEQREKERRAIEDEKQRVILEERERTEKALSEITDLVQKAKEAVELKKREDFKMLKEQMEDALKNKALERKQEQEADAKYLEEAQKREVTTATIEDEMKNKAREELIKYYEELTREMEYREFRAQWLIRRRELDSTRAQFLAQEQARLDSLRDQMTQRPVAQTPVEAKDVTTAQSGRDDGERPVVDSSEEKRANSTTENVSTSVSVPSPSLVSLIASGVRTDALLRAEQQKNTADLSDFTVKADNVNEPREGRTEISSESVNDEGSHRQAGELSSEAGTIDSRGRKTWDSPAESATELRRLKEGGSGRKTWETPEGEIKIGSPLPTSHPSDSSIQFAMYSDKTKSGEEALTSGHRRDTLKTSTPHALDSSLQSILYPSNPSVTTPVPDVQATGFVTQPLRLDGSSLVTSHPSDSSAQDILYGGNVTPGPSEDRSPSAQGHPSDSSEQYLLYSSGNVEGAGSEAPVSEHGHPSGSSISNLLYPCDEGTATPHATRLSPHGHPSDSQVSLSQGTAAQVMRHSSRSTWQHPSDASVQKLLEDINILGESQQSTRGTPPPSVAQDIIYSQIDGQASSSVSHTRGTPPKSVAQDILYPKGEESGQVPTGIHTRGGPPSSVIQDIMYPSGEGTLEETRKISTRGHEPEVKITKIMYYVKDEEGRTEEELQTKQLEFEDVWLASQVEPLQDNFDILDDNPSSNLLQGALGSFPVAQGSDDEDTDAAQLMSLPVLLQRSVMAPLLAQISLVNSAIVAYFMDDHHINKHFILFKKLLFMEDGEFSLSLSNQLFEKLASGVTPREMCSATVLNGIVGKALQLSVYSDTTEHAQNLAFALKSLPEIFKPNEMGTLDFLELRYRVEWPVNIVITEKSVVKYNKIFSFMLRLKRLSWVLRDVWFHLKHIAYSRNAAMSPQIRQLQLYRHEMQHFVHNLEGYLSNQILNVSWSEFQERLLNVTSLDDLHNQHAEYLRKAIFRSLLSRKAAPVMSIISDLGTLILKLRAQLLASPWQQDPHTGHVTHPAFDVMCNTHKAFKEYSGFLFTVVSKLVNRGYQSHLADFLLRINFNNFYKVE